MSDAQDSILCHIFIQQIPISINDKIQSNQDNLKEAKHLVGGEFQGKQGLGNDIKGNGKQDIISDNG